MKLEISTPKECMDCVFCEEMCFCGLMYGEPTNVYEDNKRAEFCPFDNKESWEKVHEQVKKIETEERTAEISCLEEGILMAWATSTRLVHLPIKTAEKILEMLR